MTLLTLLSGLGQLLPVPATATLTDTDVTDAAVSDVATTSAALSDSGV